MLFCDGMCEEPEEDFKYHRRGRRPRRPENNSIETVWQNCRKIYSIYGNRIWYCKGWQLYFDAQSFTFIDFHKYLRGAAVTASPLPFCLATLGISPNRGITSPPTISSIIAVFKRFVNQEIGANIWQRGFYDRIVRNETEYLRAWEYIEYNALKEYPKENTKENSE